MCRIIQPFFAISQNTCGWPDEKKNFRPKGERLFGTAPFAGLTRKVSKIFPVGPILWILCFFWKGEVGFYVWVTPLQFSQLSPQGFAHLRSVFHGLENGVVRRRCNQASGAVIHRLEGGKTIVRLVLHSLVKLFQVLHEILGPSRCKLLVTELLRPSDEVDVPAPDARQRVDVGSAVARRRLDDGDAVVARPVQRVAPVRHFPALCCRVAACHVEPGLPDTFEKIDTPFFSVERPGGIRVVAAVPGSEAARVVVVLDEDVARRPLDFEVDATVGQIDVDVFPLNVPHACAEAQADGNVREGPVNLFHA
mmetsp:Transcript_25934/g.51679  ORF Transcript_25934/g.51679 Transcript_25934/m.51679 type:complete len:308 (+) Transcript_25934:91-1014(+)